MGGLGERNGNQRRDELVERVWGEWKTRVLSAAERGIGKKKI